MSFIFAANISFKFNNVSRDRFVSATGNEVELNPLHLPVAFRAITKSKDVYIKCVGISNESEIDRDVNLYSNPDESRIKKRDWSYFFINCQLNFSVSLHRFLRVFLFLKYH